METSQLIFKLIFVVAVFAISLVVAMYSTYAERKVAAFLQDRLGPNRAGPFGVLQPLADGVKMFMKEEIIPGTADKALFIICVRFSMALQTPFSPSHSPADEGGRRPPQVSHVSVGPRCHRACAAAGVWRLPGAARRRV